MNIGVKPLYFESINPVLLTLETERLTKKLTGFASAAHLQRLAAHISLQ
jgi:hypothetical protein